MTITTLIPSSETCGSQGAFIFIGQAGCQIGSALWTLFNAEHSVEPDGLGMTGDANKKQHICFYKDSIFYKEDEYHRRFCYQEMERSGKFVPRTLFVDLEPTVIDEIRTGCYKDLFSPDWSFHEYSRIGDGSGVFSRAYNTVGRCIIGNVMKTIRQIAEKTERLNVVNIARSYGGGTGSGLGSLILEGLHDKYPKVMLSESNILNSDDSTSHTVEPYNTLFGIESSCTSGAITFLYNNQALQNICFQKLRIEKPVFSQINRLMSHGISGIYSSERFPGYGSCDMHSILTNLIPYPRIQLAVCSMAPIISKKIMRYEPSHRPVDMIDNILSDKSAMFDINLNTGSFVSCCMIYRGMVSPNSISTSHNILMNKQRMKLVEWSPRGIKSGHSPLSIVALPDFDLGVSQLSMTMLSNHTNISEPITRGCVAAHIMLRKKAFLHWYLEHGMEIEDFTNALENAMLLALDYKEIDTSPEKADQLSNHQENFEVDESGKKIKIKDSRSIEIENIMLLLSEPRRAPKKIPIEPTVIELTPQERLEQQNKMMMANILSAISDDDRRSLMVLAEAQGIDSKFLIKRSDESETDVNPDEIKVFKEMMKFSEKSRQSIITASISLADTSSKSKVGSILVDLMDSEKELDEMKQNDILNILKSLTPEFRQNLIYIAKVNGIYSQFLTDFENGVLHVVTIEMIHILNTLLEMADRSMESETEASVITDKLLKSKLEDAIEGEEGNEELNKNTVMNIFNSISKDDRKSLIAIADAKGVDPKFLMDLDKGELNDVNIGMVHTLTSLLEIVDTSTLSTNRLSFALKDKSLKSKVSLILAKDNDNTEFRSSIREVLKSIPKEDRKSLVSVAISQGIDAQFLIDCDKNELMDVNRDTIKKLESILEIVDKPLKSISKLSVTLTDRSSQFRIPAILADNDPKSTEDDDDNLTKSVMPDLLNIVTAGNRKSLISIAETQGINAQFLIDLDNGKLEEVNMEMIQTLSTLIDINDRTNQSKLSLRSQSMSEKSKSMANILRIALRGDKGSEKESKTALLDMLLSLTDEERENLIALARAHGLDESILRFFDKSFLISMLNDPNFVIDIDIFKKLNSLFETINPENTEMYKSDYETAVKSIQPLVVKRHSVRVNLYRLFCALTTKRSYEESFVSCIYPRTTLTNINYFYQLNSGIKAVDLVVLRSQPTKSRCQNRENIDNTLPPQ